MIKIADLIIDDIVSFNTYGTGTTNNVAGGKLIGISGGSNLRNPQLAATNHANIYSSLPPLGNTPNNYTKYNYLVIKLTDGTIVEIGIPWIIEITLTRVARGTATIVITDFNSTDHKQLLIDLLDGKKSIIPSYVLTVSE
jgi:hypothetical protein